MIRVGIAPFLECSSKGDKRFSAMYARIAGDIQTIEERYQAFKVFSNGDTGLKVKYARGAMPVNKADSRKYYQCLWEMYFVTNRKLYEEARQYTGFSDLFGQAGHACQAEAIHNLVRSGLRSETEVRVQMASLMRSRKELSDKLKLNPIPSSRRG